MTACCKNRPAFLTCVLLLQVAWGLRTAQAQHGPEPSRYEPRDPLSLTLPRRPVTRRDYVEFLRPFAQDYEMTPQADQWGWRHGPLRLLPPLAAYIDLDGAPCAARRSSQGPG